MNDKIKYYVAMTKTEDGNFVIEGVTKNARVNQFTRKNKVVNKRLFARKLRGSKLLVK